MPGYDSNSDLHGDECTVFNIPQTALSALLKILRKKGFDVPMVARTFMSML